MKGVASLWTQDTQHFLWRTMLPPPACSPVIAQLSRKSGISLA